MANAEIRKLVVRASDGLELAVEDAGPRFGNHRAPLLCLAGLTRTKRDFHELRDYFAFHPDEPRRVVLMDTRGRGGSQRAPDASSYTVQKEADDAAQVACALGLHGLVCVGTSRGGILAMILALTRPALMRGAILNDIGPRIAGAGLARLKTQLPKSRVPANWDEATELVKAALEPHFPAYQQEDWELYARLTFDEHAGLPVRAFDPAILGPLSEIPDGLPFIDLSGPYKALVCRPTLVIHGEHSDLLDKEILDLAASLGANTHTVPGEGHAPGLRGDVLNTINTFLSDQNL